jgi:hypothetical protein
MNKLSTGLTILFKMVIPIFWVVFFGSITGAALFFAPEGSRITAPYFKWMITLVYLGWTIILYFTLYQLKRVEGNEKGLYISNYIKHAQIAFNDIRQFNQFNLGLFYLVKISFTRKTYFGNSVYFLASPKRFTQFTSLYADKLP